jgi:ADP-heptose:LPS heptosyltransferase
MLRNSRVPGRWLIFLLVLVRLPFSLRRCRPAAVRHVLVLHHLLLGDTLMLTSLLAKLAEQYPDAQLQMAAPKASAPLYIGHPYRIDAIAFDPRDVRTIFTLLRQPRPDVVLLPADNRHSWLARALGARWIVGFAGDHPAWKNWFVDELRPFPATPVAWPDIVATLIDGPPPAAHVTDRWPAPPHMPFTPPARPYCVLHVGASTPLKRWEPDKWRTLAAALTARGLTVTWSAGRGEETIVTACDPDRVYRSFAGALDLPQLWHLLANAALLIAPDTGVAHLGRLVGVPTVTLFGPGSATLYGGGDFWRNAHYRAVTIDPFPCRDQTRLFGRDLPWVSRCARSTAECPAPRCMQAIDTAMVEAAVDELLHRPAQPAVQ